MQNRPKHLAVLNAAAKKAGWGKPLPAGVFRGVAQFMGYGSYSAAVAEVSVGPNNAIKVHRLVLATNCGHAVNPQQIAAQVEGGVGEPTICVAAPAVLNALMAATGKPGRHLPLKNLGYTFA